MTNIEMKRKLCSSSMYDLMMVAIVKQESKEKEKMLKEINKSKVVSSIHTLSCKLFIHYFSSYLNTTLACHKNNKTKHCYYNRLLQHSNNTHYFISKNQSTVSNQIASIWKKSRKKPVFKCTKPRFILFR